MGDKRTRDESHDSGVGTPGKGLSVDPNSAPPEKQLCSSMQSLSLTSECAAEIGAQVECALRPYLKTLSSDTGMFIYYNNLFFPPLWYNFVTSF